MSGKYKQSYLVEISEVGDRVAGQSELSALTGRQARHQLVENMVVPLRGQGSDNPTENVSYYTRILIMVLLKQKKMLMKKAIAKPSVGRKYGKFRH